MFIVLAQIPTPPFSERLLLAIVGPLVSAILGTLIIGLVIWWVTNRAQVRHAENERQLQNEREDNIRAREQKRADDIREIERQRADQERAREHRRADNELRHELISAMTAAASELYLATQSYWRATTDETISEELEDTRKMLALQYHKSRTEAQVIESRLGAFFVSPQPRENWHKVADLLTVRYFQLIKQDSPALYERNAKGTDGHEHSGLSVAELRDVRKLLAAYHQALHGATESVFTNPLRDRAAT